MSKSCSRESEILIFRLISGHFSLNGFLYKIWKAVSPKCTCGYNEETVEHYLCNCIHYSEQRKKWRLKGSLQNALRPPNLEQYFIGTGRFNAHETQKNTSLPFRKIYIKPFAYRRCLDFYSENEFKVLLKNLKE